MVNANAKVIPWPIVDKALIEGSIGTEIAAQIGVCPETLYRATEREKGVSFAVYAQEKRAIGDANIKNHQYRKALGLEEKGDNTLLICLGKTRCGQKEEKNINISTDEQVPKWLQNHLNTSKDLVNDSKSE